ncbi:MAG: 50S ribosomal protein L1 [Chloroflexi bacterium]|nr:50S ribosomal protein L1 [Chloroflexota bacterium]
MAKRGKKYEEVAKLVDSDKRYLPDEAIDLAKKTSYVKFDASMEVHLRMGADPKHADQQIRGVASMPHGLGKQVRVLVFAQAEAIRIAQQAGADFIGDDETMKKIEGGWVDFDVAIGTPDMMSKVGKLGRVLGRRGLMPNQRSGTVVQPEDIPRAIDEARQGRMEFRLDRSGVIHAIFGKVSFDDDKLKDNLAALMEAIMSAKPTGIKGQYVRGVAMTTAMGPAIRVDIPAITSLKSE